MGAIGLPARWIYNPDVLEEGSCVAGVSFLEGVRYISYIIYYIARKLYA